MKYNVRFFYIKPCGEDVCLGWCEMPVIPRIGETVVPADAERAWRTVMQCDTEMQTTRWRVLDIEHQIDAGDVDVFITPIVTVRS
jgi:hypothetical protein